ncbi:hypothetical protein ACQ4PT_022050 [Festuca glaucescens]
MAMRMRRQSSPKHMPRPAPAELKAMSSTAYRSPNMVRKAMARVPGEARDEDAHGIVVFVEPRGLLLLDCAKRRSRTRMMSRAPTQPQNPVPVSYSDRPERDLGTGVELIVGQVVMKLVESLSQRDWFFRPRRLGMRMRSALMAAVLLKRLWITSEGGDLREVEELQWSARRAESRRDFEFERLFCRGRVRGGRAHRVLLLPRRPRRHLQPRGHLLRRAGRLPRSRQGALPYREFGCDRYVVYHGAAEHQHAFPCAPCSCPKASYAFVGSPSALLGHFAAAHSRLAVTVLYGRSCNVSLPLSQRWHAVVREEDKSVLLVCLGALGAVATAVSLV